MIELNAVCQSFQRKVVLASQVKSLTFVSSRIASKWNNKLTSVKSTIEWEGFDVRFDFFDTHFRHLPKAHSGRRLLAEDRSSLERPKRPARVNPKATDRRPTGDSQAARLIRQTVMSCKWGKDKKTTLSSRDSLRRTERGAGNPAQANQCRCQASSASGAMPCNADDDDPPRGLWIRPRDSSPLTDSSLGPGPGLGQHTHYS